jgi:hypothetical protein
MISDIDFRALASVLSTRDKLAEWLASGGRRIVLDSKPSSQAFTPGFALLGCNPDMPWNEELVLLYRKYLSREQQDWFRQTLARELEVLDPHLDGAGPYVSYLLRLAQAVRAREIHPHLLLSLIARRFPKSQDVFDSVLLAWCNLPTGIEYADGPESASEALIDRVLEDDRYRPADWALHLLLGLARKTPTKLAAHLERFSDDAHVVLVRCSPDRIRGALMKEIKHLAGALWPRVAESPFAKELQRVSDRVVINSPSGQRLPLETIALKPIGKRKFSMADVANTGRGTGPRTKARERRQREVTSHA